MHLSQMVVSMFFLSLLGCTQQSIHDAVNSGNIEAVEHAIAYKRECVNQVDSVGWYPLHYAAYQGREDIAKLLITSNANVMAVDKHGQNALHAAALKNQTGVGKILIQSGMPLNELNDDGSAPLHIACFAGAAAFAEILLIAGADPNVSDESKWTPLHSACSGGSLDTVKVMVSGGSAINAESTNLWTPLDVAREKKREAIVQYLLGKGAKSSADIQRSTSEKTNRSVSLRNS